MIFCLTSTLASLKSWNFLQIKTHYRPDNEHKIFCDVLFIIAKYRFFSFSFYLCYQQTINGRVHLSLP